MRSELLKFLPNFPVEQTLCVTLTMKQYTRGQKLDEINAAKNMRYFLNLMNAEYFGHNFKRNKKRLLVIPSLEVSYSGRLHYHLTIKMPDPSRAESFKKNIEFYWYKTEFSDYEIDIQHAYNVAGWNHYITKQTNIDWENTQLH